MQTREKPLKYSNKIFLKFFTWITTIILFVTVSLTAVFAAAGNKAGDQGDVKKAQRTFGATTDLSVTISDSPDPVMRGANVTYTITVNNSTANDAQNFLMRVYISNAATFASFTAPNGFNCSPPAVGSTDLFTCTAATVAGNSTNVFTLVLKVDSDAGLGASLYQPVTISASNDTNSGNNSAAEATDLVGGIFVTENNGNYQTANINTPFPTNLRVRVTDGNYNPLAGVDVTFTAPATGASGTFANGMTTVVVTSDADGYATAPTFTANGSTGDYQVTATTQNANGSATFNLTNIAPMTFTVSNTNDGGAGSLRQAILDANDNSGNDTINFDSSVFSGPQTIILTSGELSVDDNGSLTINGPGAYLLTISGNNASRVFSVSGDLILNDVKISNGFISGESGGGLLTFGGSLQINRCAFYNNVSGGGGAIFSFANNLVINQSTFSGNQTQSGGQGGAILLVSVEGSTTTSITNSTFNGNTATAGGAIYKGSPIFGGDPLELNLTSVTIAGNTATDTGGGIFIEDGNVNIINSIIAGNTGDDINGTINSQGHNLIQSTNNTSFVGGTPQATDITGANPLLAPLANNGGRTDTMALQTGSPAIDKGTTADFTMPINRGKQVKEKADAPQLAADQRGYLRPYDNPGIANAADGADIGAFEAGAVVTAAGVSISGRVLLQNGYAADNVVITLTDQNGAAQTVKANSFGFYRFEDVAAGQTYTLSARSRRLNFAPQIVFLNDDLVNVDFTLNEH